LNRGLASVPTQYEKTLRFGTSYRTPQDCAVEGNQTAAGRNGKADEVETGEGFRGGGGQVEPFLIENADRISPEAVPFDFDQFGEYAADAFDGQTWKRVAWLAHDPGASVFGYWAGGPAVAGVGFEPGMGGAVKLVRRINQGDQNVDVGGPGFISRSIRPLRATASPVQWSRWPVWAAWQDWYAVAIFEFE